MGACRRGKEIPMYMEHVMYVCMYVCKLLESSRIVRWCYLEWGRESFGEDRWMAGKSDWCILRIGCLIGGGGIVYINTGRETVVTAIYQSNVDITQSSLSPRFRF